MMEKLKQLRECENRNTTPESRRFIIILALSAAALILGESALAKFEFATWIKISLAVAHVPFTVWLAIYGLKILNAMDELQRHIHLQSFVFGITAAAVYLLTSNLLNEAGIGNGNQTWMFWPMLWIFYSIRYSWLLKTYRD